MKLPLVSIVVNNYNNEPYLAECLDALIAQTHKNIEIVVVDALSTDGSRLLLDKYAKSDSRIKLIYSESYIKYPAISYNLGFLNCAGDYIAINDPDDISMPDRISKQLEYLLSNDEIDIVGCNCIEFNDQIEQLVVTTVEQNVKLAAPPARNPSLMFHKMVIAKFGVWKWWCEYAADFEWLYRFYFFGAKFYILPEALIRYRRSHGKNISNKRAINQTFKLAIFRLYFGFMLLRFGHLKWWKQTFSTLAHACSLLAKFIIRKLIY